MVPPRIYGPVQLITPIIHLDIIDISTSISIRNIENEFIIYVDRKNVTSDNECTFELIFQNEHQTLYKNV